jgi:peptidoglycan L-alanyl-D-glutamate endopeptidase CwlK
MFSFSDSSLKKLEGVHPDLIKVVCRAIALSEVDFKIIEGVRTPARQKILYAQGRTKPGPIVTWTLRSNHFVNPKTGFGHAIDVLPAPYDWKHGKVWDQMAKAMFEAADELDTPIRWGADWDRDGKPRERGETDSPHFELWR